MRFIEGFIFFLVKTSLAIAQVIGVPLIFILFGVIYNNMPLFGWLALLFIISHFWYALFKDDFQYYEWEKEAKKRKSTSKTDTEDTFDCINKFEGKRPVVKDWDGESEL